MSAPSLTRRLIWTLVLGAAVLWLISVGLAITSLHDRLNTAFDSNLRETAERLLPLALDSLGELAESDGDADHQIPLYDDTGDEYLVYQLRSIDGDIDLRSHDAPEMPFAAPLTIGFAEQDPWRIYTLPSTDGRTVLQVAEPLSHRNDSLFGAIVALALPVAVFIPLAVAGIAFAVRSGLAPVRQFAGEIAQRQPANLSAVGASGLPAELLPVASAVDGLIARLKAALDSERSFAANSAHELRTPIAGSLAQTQRLIAELDDGAPRERAMQIEASLHRLAGLAAKLLQLSRADAGIARASGPIDLTPAVRLVAEDVRRGLPDADRLRVSIRSAPVAAIDLDAFGIAVRNLIDNALRHGEPSVPVEVVADAESVTVTNGGPPVPPEKLAHLTRRFVRGNTTASGTGLGLAIAETIMQQAGGALELMSPAPGRSDGFAARLVLKIDGKEV